MHHALVFGTLKEGFPNFGIRRAARVQGTFRTRMRWPPHLVGGRRSPWLLDTPVRGQVFEVTGEVLAAMDRLERIHEPDGYRRLRIEVMPQAGEARQRHAYLIPAGLLTPDLPHIKPFAQCTPEHARLDRRRAA